MIVKPMLAQNAPSDLSALQYPQIVQPKFDGIRCLIVDGIAVSRTAKPIRNAEIQAALGNPKFNGLDGELLVGAPQAPDAMQRTSEFVMAPNKVEADWCFYVFDLHNAPDAPYSERWEALESWFSSDNHILGLPDELRDRFKLVVGKTAYSAAEVENIESEHVRDGYEGAILRDPRAAYKNGRSGKLGPLLKVKRFADSEAVVIDAYERHHNWNPKAVDAFGRTERSTRKEGLSPAGDLGGLRCQTPEGVIFDIGTGYTAAQRKVLWDFHQGALKLGGDSLIGRIVKYKHFEVGVKTAPRFPVFLGFRDPDDM